MFLRSYRSTWRRPLLQLAVAIVVWSGAGHGYAATSRGSSIYGVVGHFLHTERFLDRGSNYWDVKNTIPVINELGVGWVHEAIYAWTHPKRAFVALENSPPDMLERVAQNRQAVSDLLAAYDAAGIKVVVAALANPPSVKNFDHLNSQFGAWIADLARTHPCIVAVQMHNEPNLRQFWRGTPEEYVNVYRTIAATIKSARPDVQIIVGAMSSLSWPQAVQWMQGAAEKGVLDFADAVAVHPYNTTAPPEVDPYFKGAAPDDPRHLEKAVHAFWDSIEGMNSGKRPLKLYYTELGYSTASKGLAAIGSPERQADYLSRLMMVHQDLRLRGIPLEALFWYDLKDDGTNPSNEQHNYGLVNFDLSVRKPAFYAYQSISRFFSHTADLEPIDLDIRVTDHASATKIMTWRRKADAALVVPFWRLDQTPEPAEDFSTRMAIPVPAGKKVSKITLRLADRKNPAPIGFASDRDEVFVQTTVRSRASWLEIEFK
jgi:Glycosyl hydrolases family 39